MIKIREWLKYLFKTTNNFVVDAVVIQQSTIFFVVGSGYVYMNLLANSQNSSLLMLCTLCQQVATNFSLARERAIEIAKKDVGELWQHLCRRYLAAVLLSGGIMAAAGSAPVIILSVGLLCGLAAVSSASHSASQTLPELATLRPITFLSAVVLGASFPLLLLAPVMAAIAISLTSAILAAKLYKLAGSARDFGVRMLPVSGSWSRLLLWMAGLATGEYDRYIFAAWNNSAVGMQYGLLSTALMLPLTVMVVAGPRLSAELLLPRTRTALVGFVLAYVSGLILIGAILLDRDQIIVFTGSALKIVFLVASADLYFYAIARNSTKALAVATLFSAVSSLGTVALLFDNAGTAALFRVLGGVGVMLSLVLLLRRERWSNHRKLAA